MQKVQRWVKKDIIKIEKIPENLNLDLLSIFSDSITINVIQNGIITKKIKPELPSIVNDVFKCKNPRCITTEERNLRHIFKLTDKATKTYRCLYCEQAYKLH